MVVAGVDDHDSFPLTELGHESNFVLRPGKLSSASLHPDHRVHRDLFNPHGARASVQFSFILRVEHLGDSHG